MSTASATLMAHTGAVKLERGDLVYLNTPSQTNTWKPIPHSQLVDAIEETLTSNHLHITKEEYAVQTGGNKLFGVMTLNDERNDHSLALGVRTSNDKVF